MQIQAYQFIKYDKNTSIKNIEKVLNSGAVICFDFEDGILNPLNMDMSAPLKEEARKQFIRLYSLIHNSFASARIGIRINNLFTSDFAKDLFVTGGKSIDTIFLPKIEQPSDVKLIIKYLNECKVEYKNLIPIIETKIGLKNLERILQTNQRPGKIAFGHCDYNLDIDAYPFYHQDSWEYWKWISSFISVGCKYEVQIINSPYLHIENEEFFSSMLDYIATKKSHFSGQVTLTTRQSELCNYRIAFNKNFKDYLDNRNKIAVDKKFALDLVAEFESNNKLKGLSKSKERLISLQEFKASKRFIHDNREIIEICFVGGCFPVQHNILFEDLFHRKLKKSVEDGSNNKLNINIIRYERFNTLLDKIQTLTNQKDLDLIVFHVRPEPYLRLIKCIYKYIDDKGKFRWSMNLPYFNLLKPEKHDIYDLGRVYNVNSKPKHTIFHKLLISTNYVLGTLIGNKRYALRSYLKTTNTIINYCLNNNISYIILGPNRRTGNCLEPSLCKALDLFISKRIGKQHYICGFENDNTQMMNQENGIHVTQAYHDLIAEKLYKMISDKRLLNLTKRTLSGRQSLSRFVVNH